MKKLIAIALSGATLSACATQNYSMTPVTDASSSITYSQGAATVASDSKNGAVKVTPMGITGGGFVKFAVAAINHGATPTNLGVENVTVSDPTGVGLHVYTTAELTKIAHDKAVRAEVAIAILGGIAAAADSSASYNSTSGYVGSTPVYFRSYDPVAANLAIDRDSANTSAAISNINQQLANITAGLHDSALQTTTVNPGMGYGGLVWAAEPKNLAEAKGPVTLTVVVNFAGEPHQFQFQLAKQ